MRIHLAGLAGAVAALAVLTACRSGGDAAGGTAGSTATAGSAGSTAAPVAGGPSSAAGAGAGQGSGKTIKICDVLSAAQAAKLTGLAYTSATSSNAEWTSSCAYDNDDATIEGVNVSYSNQNAQSTWNIVHAGKITDVSGLGDKAFWDNDNTLYVLAGNDLIQVNGLESQKQSVALAQPVLAALS
jgi:hypothetical protein